MLDRSHEIALMGLLRVFAAHTRAGGRIGDDTFNAIVGAFPQIAFEAVIFRMGVTGAEVYLTQRRADDKNYPLQWHCPGSFYRLDEQHEHVIGRLNNLELKTAKITEFMLCHSEPVIDMRGSTHSQVYLCQISGEPTGGTWHSVQDLLARRLEIDLVAHHYLIIGKAYEKYSL